MLEEELNIKFFDDFESFYSATTNDVVGYNTVFQNKNWLSLVYAEFTINRLNGKYFGCVVFLNGNPVVGGHFFYKQKGNKKGIFLLTNASGQTDYNDFLYFSNIVDQKSIVFMLEKIASKYPGLNIYLARVPESSPLSKCLLSTGVAVLDETIDCAEICINGTFDEYWKSLKKGIRQNIRTAKNRLATDNKTYSIDYYFNRKIPSDVAKRLLKIYEIRRKQKNKHNGPVYIVKDFIRRLRNKKFCLMYQAMSTLENSFAATISINDTLSAYFYGLEKNGIVSVIQVSFLDSFSRYSPGMILLSDALKTIFDEKKLVIFDLATGDEKYKFYLGAKKHHTLTFVYGQK